MRWARPARGPAVPFSVWLCDPDSEQPSPMWVTAPATGVGQDEGRTPAGSGPRASGQRQRTLPTLSLTDFDVEAAVAVTLTEIFLPFIARVILSLALVAFLIFLVPANHWNL